MLWPWRGLAATAPIRPLAWEPPYAAGVALKTTKKKTKNKDFNEGSSHFCLTSAVRYRTEEAELLFVMKSPFMGGQVSPLLLRVSYGDNVHPQWSW